MEKQTTPVLSRIENREMAMSVPGKENLCSLELSAGSLCAALSATKLANINGKKTCTSFCLQDSWGGGEGKPTEEVSPLSARELRPPERREFGFSQRECFDARGRP